MNLKESDFYKVALSMIPGVGIVTARNLMAYVGNLEDIFNKPKRVLTSVPGVGSVLADTILSGVGLHEAEKELRFIEKNKIKVIGFSDGAYPSLLKECVDAPIVLYAKGESDLNGGKLISVVGTRNASEYGYRFLDQLVEALAMYYPETIIVSGLAYGIDIYAHRLALAKGLKTVAVLGHGLDRIYPALHKGTAREIIQQGALISDFPSETNPDRQNFVKRNRIVAGMSSATLVIESGIKGGALLTSEMAFSYNREVLALPGNVGLEFSKGCNYLIKTNRASLMESIEDVELALNWERGKKQNTPSKALPELSAEELKVYKAIKGEGKVNINHLCRMLEMPLSELNTIVFQLEFKSVLRQLPGNLFEVT